MHRFEYFDWTNSKVTPPYKLREMFSKRHDRIANCSHEWEQEEFKKVMRPIR